MPLFNSTLPLIQNLLDGLRTLESSGLQPVYDGFEGRDADSVIRFAMGWVIHAAHPTVKAAPTNMFIRSLVIIQALLLSFCADSTISVGVMLWIN